MTYLPVYAMALLLVGGPADANPLYTLDTWPGVVTAATSLCTSNLVEDFLAWLPGVLIAMLALVLALHENRHSRLLRQQLAELQRAHRALADSEQRYRQLLEAGQLGLWQLDATGRTLYLNAVMRALLQVESTDPLAEPASPGLIPMTDSPLPADYGCYEAVLVNQQGQPRQVLVAEIRLAQPAAGILRLVFAPSLAAASRLPAKAAGHARPPTNRVR